MPIETKISSKISFRQKWHSVIWAGLLPTRWYLNRFPITRGKGVLRNLILVPLLPPRPNEFVATVAGNRQLYLQYRDTIGITTLLEGSFESAEVNCLRTHLGPGSIAIDVGANIGIFTIPLADKVGKNGQIWAFEPIPENIHRLKKNISLNNLQNIKIRECAVGDKKSNTKIYVCEDLAYASQDKNINRANQQGWMDVEITTLDAEWLRAGQPRVQIIKIDVEGAEISVLEGAKELIARQRPQIMLESTSQEQLQAITEKLSEFGYKRTQPSNFSGWNYLFIQKTNHRNE
jgi:FkbM family methyltransferase